VILPPDTLQAVGFAPEEALFPWPARSFSGFRLLSEYFSAREKFHFIDICRLDAKTLVSAGNKMDIFVYLDRAMPDLERVRESLPNGEFRTWQPFHRLTRRHADDAADSSIGGFYGTARRDTTGDFRGTEVYLLPHDAGFDPERESSGVLSVDALCCNRDLPAALPFGGGRPTLRLVEGAAAVTGLSCVTAPTPTLRMPVRERGFWRLISHLSLGHLSVVGGETAADALREVLRLYDCRESTESRTAIRSLLNVTSRPGTARIPGLSGPGARSGGFCRGLDVTLTFDDQAWTTGGLYVLASVLDRFLALHATVNSFVRTEAVLRGRPGVAASWPARAGSQVLL
jgi:type VI secretion system protein ImpG